MRYGTSIVRLSDGKILDFEFADSLEDARGRVEDATAVRDPEAIYQWMVSRVEVVNGE